MKIINLTMHNPTCDQADDGVFNYKHDDVVKLLNVKPGDDLIAKANKLADIANLSGANAAMLGGHPLLTCMIAENIRAADMRVLFAHSDRISVDNGDGTKTSRFVFTGWWDSRGKFTPKGELK